MEFDKDIIDSIIKHNGIKVFVIGLSFYDFDDKKETVNYLNAKYSDEFNGLIKEFIEENNHLGLKMIEEKINPYMDKESINNKIKFKRKTY